MDQRASPVKILKSITEQEGVKVLFSGMGPRILWISAGGAVFLGAYEFAKDILQTMEKKDKDE